MTKSGNETLCCGDNFENLRKKVNRLEFLGFLVVSYLFLQPFLFTNSAYTKAKVEILPDQTDVANLAHHNQLDDNSSSSSLRLHQSKTEDLNERGENLVVLSEVGKSRKEQNLVSPPEMKSAQKPMSIHSRRHGLPNFIYWQAYQHGKHKEFFQMNSGSKSLVTKYPQLPHIDNVSSRKLQTHDTNTSSVDLSTFDPNLSMCPISQKDTFVFHVQHDLNATGASWHLLDLKSSNTISLAPLSGDSSFNSTASFFACLTPGMYKFSIFHNITQKTSCESSDYCYQIAINDVSIVEKKSFVETFDHDILITTNGEGHELQCLKEPILSPSDPSEPNVIDVEIANKLDIIMSLTSSERLQNTKSPQYRAACLLLYDDRVVSADEVDYLIERYTLTLFLYTTQQEDEILKLFGRETCDVMQCNNEGYISMIDSSKCDANSSYCFAIIQLIILNEI